MKLSEMSDGKVFLIQFCIATIVSLLFQFVFPLSWQPLDNYMHGGKAKHGDPYTNMVIFTISQWYFSFSVAWLFYRDNRYVNNFVFYSIIPLGFIAVYEFSIGLFYDYIHLFPLLVDMLILWKKRHTLDRKLVPYYLITISTFLYAAYFLGLAYYGAPVSTVIFNWAINTAFMVGIAMFFKGDRVKKKEEKKLPLTEV